MDENIDDSQNTNMASGPNDSDTHVDLDRSDQRNLIRLIGLMQAGWTISRGHGPRHHPRCLWCHGDMSDRTEILIHNKCNNAWAAGCFMDSIHYEYDKTSHQRLSCPLCRSAFHTRPWDRPRYPEQFPEFRYPEPTHSLPQHDFELPRNINISAHIRIVMYNPASVIKAMGYSKTLMFMAREEMAKMALFGRNKIIFDAIDNVKTEWETVFTRWVLINWKDNNEYRASPLMAHQETELLELLAAKGLGSPVTGEAAQQLEEWICTQGRLPGYGMGYPILQDISAQILQEGAAGRGGLATAVAAFKPDSEDDDIISFKEMMAGGKEEAIEILRAEREKEKGSVQHMERITAGVSGLFRAFCMVMDDKSDGSHGSDEEPDEDEDEDYPEDEDYVEEDGEDLDSDSHVITTLPVAQPDLPAISNPEDSDPEPFV